MSDDGKVSYINGARLDYDSATGKVTMSPERVAQLQPLRRELVQLVADFAATIESCDESEMRGVLIKMGGVARRAIGATTGEES